MKSPNYQDDSCVYIAFLLTDSNNADSVASISQNYIPFAKFNLAIAESYKDGDSWKERTEWHPVLVWGMRADAVVKYTSNGSRIYVEGSLQTRQWEDKEGVKRYTTEIRAWDVQFLDSKPEKQGAAPATEAANIEPYDDDELPL